MSHRYIDMDFEDALVAKFESGRKKHRKNGEANFTGDAVEELFQEMLDSHHYAGEAEACGVPLPGWQDIYKYMGLYLQALHREPRTQHFRLFLAFCGRLEALLKREGDRLNAATRKP